MPSISQIKFPHIEEPGLRVRAQRYFTAIFCFLYFAIGSGVIVCGAILVSRRQQECSFMGMYYSGVCILLAAGCFTSFFSLCGCLQTRRNTASHYYTPLLLVLVVVIVMEIAAAAASHILYSMATGGRLMAEIMTARDEFWTSDSKSECINKIQNQFKCCGMSNYTEWARSNSSQHAVYPSSCMCDGDNAGMCVNPVGNISINFLIFSQPCYDLLVDDLYDNLLIARIVAPMIVLIQLMFLVLVIFFLHQIHNKSLVGAYIVRQPSVSGRGNVVSETAPSCETNWVEMRERQVLAAKNVPQRQQNSFQQDPPPHSISRDETVHL